MHKGNVTIAEKTEILAVIKEEQTSPPISLKLASKDVPIELIKSDAPKEITEVKGCLCGLTPEVQSVAPNTSPENIQKLLQEREAELRKEYDKLLEKEISLTKERFDFILQNEQVRASFMLREAHRERQEKIRALESQLECKNLAALMYVMCTERSRSKLEKMRLIEEYNKYIMGLQDILCEGQELILHLSRGYKTAARVDHEWRNKMMSVVAEFMKFISNFAGGPDENNQFFINLPKLLKTEAPIIDDPKENPCEVEEDDEMESIVSTIEDDGKWWNSLTREDRPFVVFGDMADFQPPQRRQVLNTIKAIKAAKTAPKIWKEYVFNDLTMWRTCNNVDEIKDKMPFPKLRRQSTLSEAVDSNEKYGGGAVSGMSLNERRATSTSVDFKGFVMSSLLRIITSASAQHHPFEKPTDKAALLGARDSMEITSTTRLRQSCQKSDRNMPKEPVTLDIGKKRRFEGLVEKDAAEDETESNDARRKSDNDAENYETIQRLGSIHHDSLEVIPSHKADKDHVIGFERFCAEERCQRMQMDEFMRGLPPYMRANPFTHFEQTFETYETCTPEQLEILKSRMEAKKIDGPEDEVAQDPLEEWIKGGVATQTSLEAMLPPCTCSEVPSPVDSNFIFDLKLLEPVKKAMNAIKKECFFDDTIQFDRFKVIGEDNDSNNRQERPTNFSSARKRRIVEILEKHPSLLDIFQANTRC